MLAGPNLYRPMTDSTIHRCLSTPSSSSSSFFSGLLSSSTLPPITGLVQLWRSGIFNTEKLWIAIEGVSTLAPISKLPKRSIENDFFFCYRLDLSIIALRGGLEVELIWIILWRQLKDGISVMALFTKGLGVFTLLCNQRSDFWASLRRDAQGS